MRPKPNSGRLRRNGCRKKVEINKEKTTDTGGREKQREEEKGRERQRERERKNVSEKKTKILQESWQNAYVTK